VIQYVAWADGEPVLSPDNYDHGTWCGGSSVGRCIDSQANVNSSSYNGLAPNAQITMFDVDNNGSFYNVPSLYNIALPPAYEAGARVHSNSWGTPNMGSYTSKALDVDEYMLENPEFLFVVAAGNDGRQGFTSVHSPGVSKNALTVGAGAVDHEYLTSFSSMGYDYDNRMIKPNIITPGTNLMSAGVRQSGQTDSCNVQQSSGTSMATPLAAASAILIKQYFENTSFWASTCDTTYRSCPLVSSGAISGALIKAAVIHSGEGMAGYESSSTALVKSFAFDAPPDKYQGWGQVLLTNVLPLEGVEDFDLYVADGEQVESFTEIRYRVVVEGTGVSLRATIVWIDPSNVMWAAKNLLNDLDLQVISPLGNVSYGNNIQGDEFNPVERVVIDTPMIGVYEVSVIAKQLVGPSQTYAIVISCDGYVDESQTSGMVPVDQSNVNYEEDTVHCLRQQQFDGPEFQLVRLQLEDWDMGASWENMSVWVYESNEDGDKLGSAFNCTFIPNADRNVSASNKIFQCTACLESDALYVAELALSPDAPAGAALNMQHVRVATPDCYNVFLSNFQPIVPMQLSGSDCNACGDGSLVMNVLMFSNVTDDDSADYTWFVGTLMVSDEQEDWYCLPQGKYTVALDDSALYSERIKHAKVVFSSAYGTTTNVTLQGTSSSVYYLGNYNTKSNDDDKSAWYESTGVIVGMTVGGLVFLCIAVCCIKSFFFPYKKKELENDVIP
ncbi:tagC, partial [Symbiodinium microadriaticum]